MDLIHAHSCARFPPRNPPQFLISHCSPFTRPFEGVHEFRLSTVRFRPDLWHVFPPCSQRQTHKDAFDACSRGSEPKGSAAVVNQVELGVFALYKVSLERAKLLERTLLMPCHRFSRSVKGMARRLVMIGA
jgi:hypothetical protein